MGLESTCISAARKPRPAGIKRGPYVKKELAENETPDLLPTTNVQQSPTPSLSDTSMEIKATALEPFTPSTSPIHMQQTQNLQGNKESLGLQMLSFICEKNQS